MVIYRRKFNKLQLTERKRIEDELAAIPAIHPHALKITSTQGFIDYFLQMQGLYNTKIEAYERLEKFHIAVTGQRKYSEFDSFRGVLNRYSY